VAGWVASQQQPATSRPDGRAGLTAGPPAPGGATAVIEVDHLTVAFPARDGGTAEVVRDVSLEIRPGERVGLVGESGSGKSLTARAVMQLIPPPGRIAGGVIRLNGAELDASVPPSRWRGTSVAMITQDPLSSLNPLVRIGVQATEMLRFHRGLSRSAARAKAAELLAAVGIPDPARTLTQFPAVLSGGMRQRVALAIAISCEPRLLIADEPTTALDVTIQAQVLDLLERTCAEYGTAVLLISHDLGVVANFCDRLLVMYGGRIVESGPTARIVENPAHPYTRALMSSVPSMTGDLPERLVSIPGSPPAGGTWAAGCAFAPRCPIARDICRSADPELSALDDLPSETGPHAAACHASRDESWGRAA
jgi:oligopeptide/dipeptide ABC transporter ATP-binding protein